MPTDIHSADDLTAVIHTWMAEQTPQIQPMFADVEQWDRDTLIRRFCILRAHLRDTVVRLFDIPQPPPNATSAWWRQQVANQADAWSLKLWNDPQALPTLLKETNDLAAVHACISLLIGFFFVAKEYDGRLNAQRVSRTMRYFLHGAETEGDPSSQDAHVDLLKLIDAREEARAVQRKVVEKCEAPSAAPVGFFEFLEQERVNGPKDAPDYDRLACGPLASSRCPAHESWEAMAGTLLVEDIQRCSADYRPLLTPDLDVKAIGAARDAERERHRKSLAKERGGPGTINGKIAWKCCGKELTRTLAHCPICGKERPDRIPHASLDDDAENVGDRHQLSPLENALASEQLKNVENALPPKVLAAFRRVVDGETDEQAARAENLSTKTLQRWRNKLRDARDAP